jgi:hypothetical protein
VDNTPLLPSEPWEREIQDLEVEEGGGQTTRAAKRSDETMEKFKVFKVWGGILLVIVIIAGGVGMAVNNFTGHNGKR